MEEISKTILKLRKERGWSQRELAKKLNVSDKLISKWENSQSTPSIEYIRELCKIFNVDMSEFVDVPKKKRKLSAKGKKNLIITMFVFLGALIFAGIFVLSVYVLVPITFKEKYIFDLNMNFINNFKGNSFRFSIGNSQSSETFIGKFENGTAEWQYKKNSENTVETLKGGIIYRTEGIRETNTTPYQPTCKSVYGLFEEMMTYYGYDTSDISVTEIPITFIRKSFDMYHFKLSADYFNDQLGDTAKIVGEPEGHALIRDDKLKWMWLETTAEYYDPLEEENKEIRILVNMSFDFSKVREIELPNGISGTDFSNSLGEGLTINGLSNAPDALYCAQKLYEPQAILTKQKFKQGGWAVKFEKDIKI